MKIHQLQGYIQQIYLVEYPHGLLLLDGCCRCDVATVQRFIEDELGRSVSELKWVLVTHMHPDHAGGAHAFRRLSACQVATAQFRGQWYGGIGGLFRFLIDILLAHLMAGRMHKPKTNLWYCPYLNADRYLNHGEVLPDFPDWQILDTRGHTDRDVSVYHEASGTVYLADLALRLKNGFTPPLGVRDGKQYTASLQRVRALRAQRFLLAHGGEAVLTDPDFDQLIAATPSKMKLWRIYFSNILKKKK